MTNSLIDKKALGSGAVLLSCYFHPISKGAKKLNNSYSNNTKNVKIDLQSSKLKSNDLLLNNNHQDKDLHAASASYIKDNIASNSNLEHTLNVKNYKNKINTLELVNKDLSELRSLLKTLGIECLGQIIQKRLNPCKRAFIGSGKIKDLINLINSTKAGLVVVDGDITPTQQRNLQLSCKVQVVDRSSVILDIFALHASTHYSKIQVELAKMEYLLPRMVGAWSHFSRQKGGQVTARGMGEKQIEVDRRLARSNIAKLKKKLHEVQKNKLNQRKKRQSEFKVALVGYTNSGKTTLMSAISSSKDQGKDQLFATLGARVKLMDPVKRPKILFVDTVGFIRNFPPSLTTSFHSTLQETLDADLCLHVVDVSHPYFRSQIDLTERVLSEIGCEFMNRVFVFNKMDLCKDHILSKILAKKYPGSFIISAFNKKDVSNLSEYIVDYFTNYFFDKKVTLSQNNKKAISFIHQHAIIKKSDYSDESEDFLVSFDLLIKPEILKKLEKLMVNFDCGI